MPRLSIWSVCLFGLGVAIVGLAPVVGQPPDAKQPDPKKGDPKKTEQKKAEPKKADPKPDPKPAPKPASKSLPEYATEAPAVILEGAPSPLDLVRGLREQGMADLALEYLRDVESKTTSADLKADISLERARCQLDAADDEPDEGARISLVGEAKEGFSNFLTANPNHPRAAEASLALARLTSLDAKAQLSKARRIDTSGEGDAQSAAIQQQRAEAAAARPLFKTAADRFKASADRIKAQIEKKPDPVLRRALIQAQFDAELASGINLFALGDTYMSATAAEKRERSDVIDEARKVFSALANDNQTPARVGWVARAWAAECEQEKDNIKVAQEAYAQVLASTSPDAEDGKRTVKFFQLRRRFVQALGASVAEIRGAERDARAWLAQYGSIRRAQAEALAVRWYLAYSLQVQADATLPPPPKVTPKTPLPPPPLSTTALAHYEEAERNYRLISQTDNEYSARAVRQRMYVVRRMLGDADRPPSEYKSFERCQMASLIQMSKLVEMEKAGAKAEDIKAKRLTVVILLERARELVTDKDNPNDVAEVLIRLIYYYERTDQPHQAAILGEYVAQNVKVPGGKAAVAGTLGLDGYSDAIGQLRITEQEVLEAARRYDRNRAIRLATFIDTKYPNDTATDRARHRLASLLEEDGKPVEAYDILLKIRPGYEYVASARLFQGKLAAQLLSAKDSPLPADRRKEVFRRTTGDLDKLPRPSAEAPVDQVRSYISARCRLAMLYLQQPKVDPDGEKADPGYAKSRGIAEQALAAVPTFQTLASGDAKALTLDGWEMKLLAEDSRTRAAYLAAQSEFAAQNYERAFDAIGPILAEINQGRPYAELVKAATGGEPKGADDAMPADGNAAIKGRIAQTAGGVDRLRQSMIVLALKIRVKQGQAEKGGDLLALLKKYGGSIEANVTTLQQVTAELSGQILAYRKAGKTDEAKALSDGFAKLLDTVSKEPQLPPAVQLFLGQSLSLVGEYGRAEEALKKVPAPPKELLAKPVAEIDDVAKRKQVGEYRRSILELLRCYRQGKKFPEAEALIAEAMGTKEKPGWAANGLDFRREFAYLYEAKGAEEPDPKKSNPSWGKAVGEWTSQMAIARKRLESIPKGADGKDDNAAHLRNKNAFFEGFFEYNRCILKANIHLKSTKLKQTYEDIGKKFADVERLNGADIVPDVRAKYAELLLEYPDLRKAYEGAGGKLFLEKPAEAGGM